MPAVRRPDTRAIRNLCSSAPPANTIGPAHSAPTNGPKYGPRKASTPPPVTRYRLAIHAEHQQFALGEVDDAHDAEDQPEADTHQAVDAADGKAGGERVQDVFDQVPSAFTAFLCLPLCSVLLVHRLHLKRPT